MSATTTRQEPTWRDILQEAYELAKKRDGLTQQKLADALGVKQQTVSAWIKGPNTPNMDVCIEIMQVCNAPNRLWLALRDAVTGVDTRRFQDELATLVGAAA